MTKGDNDKPAGLLEVTAWILIVVLPLVAFAVLCAGVVCVGAWLTVLGGV